MGPVPLISMLIIHVTFNLSYHNDGSLGLPLKQSLASSTKCLCVKNKCFYTTAGAMGLAAKRLRHVQTRWGRRKEFRMLEVLGS